MKYCNCKYSLTHIVGTTVVNTTEILSKREALLIPVITPIVPTIVNPTVILIKREALRIPVGNDSHCSYHSEPYCNSY